MSTTPRTNSKNPSERQADVISEHLPSGYTAHFDGVPDGAGNASDSRLNSQESSLKLQGGDIHRDLYKINARARLQQRAATFSHPTPPPKPSLPGGDGVDEDTPASRQQVPGGFRREFVRQKLGRFNSVTVPVTKSFVEFLDLYGSFAGEDLAESDDDNEEAVDDRNEDHEGNGGRGRGRDRRGSGSSGSFRGHPSETRPLLGRRKSSKRTAKKGDAGVAKSFFTLLKAFVGTGIMFLPKAFNNGGILFSSIVLIVISLVSTLAFHLLLQCRSRYGGGYGELADAIVGPKMRALVLGSITLSQLGFVCAGTVFIAQNLHSFFDAVISGPNPLSTNILIALQMVVIIPLSFVRNISKLGPAALLADVFILLGLAYIYYFDIATLSAKGISDTVQLFNPAHYAMTIGASIFTFEGIGLLLPIQSSMAKPEKFEPLLYSVMLLITIIFTSVGVLCYATFGADTQIEIISNYPQDSKLVNAIQFIYSIAVLVGTPVQLFPALRILEGKLFGHSTSGKKSSATKWKKNAFRTAVVLFCTLISILGSNNLDRFVSLIGSFACVPLVYIYPPFLHYKGVAESKLAKVGNVVFMLAGLVAMVFTTAITVINSFA